MRLAMSSKVKLQVTLGQILDESPQPNSVNSHQNQHELTFYFTTRSRDLRHAEVSGAYDIIVTGSVPEMRTNRIKSKYFFLCCGAFFPTGLSPQIQETKSRRSKKKSSVIKYILIPWVLSRLNKRESCVCKGSPVQNSEPHLLTHGWKLAKRK